MTEKELKEDVKELIAYVKDTHKYSMSKIYGLYNQVFQTNEVPQACASCLIRKVKALEKWLEKQEPAKEEIPQQAETPRKRKSRNKKQA